MDRQEDIDKGVKAMDELTDFFNSGNYAAQEVFVKRFKNEHRTLQQNVLRAFFGIMVDSAEQYENKRFDARNEAALLACKIMVDGYKEKQQFAPNQGLPVI